VAEDDFCYLTTTGRIRGVPHEIEIWYELDPVAPATVFLLAGAGHDSDWVRNVSHDPIATVRFGTDPTEQQVRARVLDEDDEESRRARDLVYAKYNSRGHGDLRDWRERALPVALDTA
jgi:hypothetical protein